MDEKVLRYDGARRRILLVENELMVALEMEQAIKEAGLCDVRVAGNEEAAREILDQTGCLAGAILDVNLSNGTSLGLADELLNKGVPVAFATGYDSNAEFLARFPDVPVISKPFGRTELLATVAWLLAAREGTSKST